MLVDLHAYSSASGGRPVEQLIDEARRSGLDAIAVVDRKASAETARAVAEGRFGDFPVFVGVEIETRDGDAIVFVPKLDPFLTREEWRALLTLEKPRLADVRAVVDREGGALLLAHPYDRSRTTSPRDRVFALEGVDAFEVGCDSADPRDTRTAMESLVAGRLAAFGGSANRGRGGRPASRWATLFDGALASQADLIKALRAGGFWAVEIGAVGEKPVPREERPPREDRPRDDRPRGDRPHGDRPHGGGGGRDGRPPRRDRR